ncbi:MAG: hypothetical protein VX740_03600, partial [Pseudomonadota bacterium]|nr:hypothetical protein [Pseudomonadota bacterium]
RVMRAKNGGIKIWLTAFNANINIRPIDANSPYKLCPMDSRKFNTNAIGIMMSSFLLSAYIFSPFSPFGQKVIGSFTPLN